MSAIEIRRVTRRSVLVATAAAMSISTSLAAEEHAHWSYEVRHGRAPLTTPPCTEGVTWFVMQHPASVSAAEVARFGAVYPMNARPVQPLNGRAIQASR